MFWCNHKLVITYDSCEGYCHWNSKNSADYPDDDDDHFCPIFAGVAFQRKHDGTESEMDFLQIFSCFETTIKLNAFRENREAFIHF